MSSNLKILLYFLKTLDDSIRVATGLRGNPDLINVILKNQNNPLKIDVSKFKIDVPKPAIKNKNVSLVSVVDDAAIVLEGVKQYANFVAQNKLKSPTPIVLDKLVPKVSKSETAKSSTLFSDVIRSDEDKQNHHEPIKIKPPVKVSPDSTQNKKSLKQSNAQAKLSSKSKERKVPANRISRVLSFGGLAVSMGFGAAEELAKRVVGSSQNQSSDGSLLGTNLFLTKSNAQKIVDTLCRVRGAALKLGQMLSIADNEMLGPELQEIFERVRQSADYMPEYQLISMMSSELGDNWQTLFKHFEMKPFAAASIGQVHKAVLHDDSLVAVKVQYPGVAESIGSDIKNVLTIMKYANIFPEGLFIDHIMNYAKIELSWEVDYVREAACQMKYRNYVEQYCYPSENFKVPIVYEELSTKKVLTSELITGIPVDKMDNYAETSDPEVKNSVLERLLRLFFRELFQFNYMQTDPNWSNFFYEYSTDTLSLIDFGNCRPYSEDFVEKYKEIIIAAINNDRQTILIKSEEIGFLSGYETELFKNAHVESVLIVGEALRESKKFDFSRQSVIKRIHDQLPIMLKHRLKPPPEEIYSLHRKLSGLFLLCCKLKVQVNCREIFDDIVSQSTK